MSPEFHIAGKTTGQLTTTALKGEVDMPETWDAIIIGAGVAGASIAYHLSLRGLKPLLIEAEHVAAGATGRSSGLVRMHYDVEEEARLAWASFAYFSRWAERVGGQCGFTRTGFLQIVPPEHNESLRANVAMHQRIGIPTKVLTAEEVRDLVPSFSTEDFELAAYEPESGYADPAATTASLVEAARGLGTRLIQGCKVVGIRIHGGRVIGVNSNLGEHDAPVVVNSAGPWAGEVARLAGVSLPLDTWTHDVMLVRRPPLVASHPAVIDDVLTMYFRVETGGLTLLALEDCNRFGDPPGRPLEGVSQGFVERAIERICRRIPGMEAATVHSTYSGRDGLSPDQHPMLGPSGPQGFYLACGFSGTGFKLGPAVGTCMAELILDGRASTVDISIFSPDRFAQGRTIQSDHPYGPIWTR
ncbi:MAG: FAD-dependent oxidoreductase [Anaerolineales bacterium]